MGEVDVGVPLLRRGEGKERGHTPDSKRIVIGSPSVPGLDYVDSDVRQMVPDVPRRKGVAGSDLEEPARSRADEVIPDEIPLSGGPVIVEIVIGGVRGRTLDQVVPQRCVVEVQRGGIESRLITAVAAGLTADDVEPW